MIAMSLKYIQNLNYPAGGGALNPPCYGPKAFDLFESKLNLEACWELLIGYFWAVYVWLGLGYSKLNFGGWASAVGCAGSVFSCPIESGMAMACAVSATPTVGICTF